MSDEKKIVNQLKRCEGQIRGVQKMIENQEDCMQVATQLKAIRSNIDSILGKVITNNFVHCLNIDIDPNDERVAQAIDLIIKK